MRAGSPIISQTAHAFPSVAVR